MQRPQFKFGQTNPLNNYAHVEWGLAGNCAAPHDLYLPDLDPKKQIKYASTETPNSLYKIPPSPGARSFDGDCADGPTAVHLASEGPAI